MKNTLSSLVRWAGIPIFAASIFALLVTPAYPKTPDHDAIMHTKILSQKSVPLAEMQELQQTVSVLTARDRQNRFLVLNEEQKTIDWWFSFLAFLTAIMAIFGAVIPFLMGRKERELVVQDRAVIRLMMDEAKATVDKIHQHETAAKVHAKEIEELKEYQSGQPEVPSKELSDAVAAVQKDPASDAVSRLRAEAIAASQSEQAERAYVLWRALLEINCDDAVAHFNAGYWAQALSGQHQGEEKGAWLRRARTQYQQALSIKPDMHMAAYNWGNSLGEEARALAATDLEGARKLWQQAGEKYQQALSIKPDKHEAVYNWGCYLLEEAKALAATDLEGARKLWQQAGEKYQQALSIKPDKHEAANNWGNALSDEAKALAATDLEGARKLWQQAGEKYQQALSIKPDKHEAANNWANSLLSERHAIRATDMAHSKELLDQAEQILLAHAKEDPGPMAYNLACVYGQKENVKECLKWLKISYEANALPNCEHLKKDVDLEPVKSDPEMSEWFARVCPPIG